MANEFNIDVYLSDISFDYGPVEEVIADTHEPIDLAREDITEGEGVALSPNSLQQILVRRLRRLERDRSGIIIEGLQEESINLPDANTDYAPTPTLISPRDIGIDTRLNRTRSYSNHIHEPLRRIIQCPVCFGKHTMEHCQLFKSWGNKNEHR